MKGTLHKTESGWHVINMQATLNGPLLQSLPLIDNGHIDGLMLYDSNEGLEVEFEIVANEGEPLGRGEQPYKQYAKLVDKATRPVVERVFALDGNYNEDTKGDYIKGYTQCQEDLKPLIHDLWQLWLDFSEVCDMEKDTPFIRKFNEIEKQINHGKNNP